MANESVLDYKEFRGFRNAWATLEWSWADHCFHRYHVVKTSLQSTVTYLPLSLSSFFRQGCGERVLSLSLCGSLRPKLGCGDSEFLLVEQTGCLKHLGMSRV